MRKVLIGALILCLSLGLTGAAMAAEFSWSGSVEFGITGGGDGLDLAGSASLTLDATAASGPWEAGITFEDEKITDGYLKYNAAAFALSMYPLGVGNDLYDLGIGDLSSNIGVKLEVPMEGFSFFAVGNKKPGEDIYNFGGGIDFTMDALGFGVIFNSDQEKDFSSYAGKVTYALDALSLTGEYGAVADGDSRFYGEVVFSFAGGGSLTGSYLGGEDYSEIYGEFTTPIAENVDFTVDATSTTEAGDTTTTYEAKIGFSF